MQSYRLLDPAIENKTARRTYVVATDKTASSDEFVDMMENVNPAHIQMVVDEVHNIGAPSKQKIMNIPCERRIGLSATHIRKWDEEGTEMIEQFFEGVAFTYTLQEAIDDEMLCQYEIHNHDVTLTQHEYENYHEHTRTIGKYNAIIQQYREKRNFTEMNRYEKKKENEQQTRARIIKGASNKFLAFEEIAKELNANEKTIVFCENIVQLDACSRILNKYSKNYRIYHTGSELNNTQRAEHLKEFERGDSDILVGIGCLDEGLDISGCSTCILVSSDGNERQYIQRRGRVLRLGEIGKIAHIHDLICYPPLLTDEVIEEQLTTVTSLLKHEMKRSDLLSEAANNREAVQNELEEKFNEFNISVEELRD